MKTITLKFVDPVSEVARKLEFTNLLGHSINVFWNDGSSIHIGYLTNHGGELNMERSGWLFEWVKGMEKYSPITSESILTELLSRRKEAWDKEREKLKTGWTQWDPLEVEGWEETNRERLSEALSPFGLKIEFQDLKDSKSSWFKINKI